MPRRIILQRDEYKRLCYEVHERDDWKCAVPQCRRRNSLHAHHIVFRSHGGDDASWNLVTLCDVCHDALHQRHMIIRDKVSGSFEEINADTGVRFHFVSGWRPSRKLQ